jgi:hypothetical protein
MGAAVHVQVNARDDKDLDEEKIKKQLSTAMGSNYDAGQKIQVCASFHPNTPCNYL